MKMNFTHTTLIIASLVVLGGIGLLLVAGMSQRVRWEPLDPDAKPLPKLSPDHWKSLASSKIFFAHMSVGRDLLDGIEDLQRDGVDAKLIIRELSEPGVLTKPVLAHALLGHNSDPARKIESFRQLVDSLQSTPPDVAFMKFCYVDISHDTDVPRLFAAYTAAMDELQARLPTTRLVHLTVPLCAPVNGFVPSVKAWIKTWLGRPGVAADNAKREEFNRLLRGTYGVKGLLIDIAEAESSSSRGRCVLKWGGQSVSCLEPDYTHDGGHLNAGGRRHVAEVLLTRLVEMECAASSAP